MERIGIIGIGGMGQYMAKNLVKKYGENLIVYDIRPEPVADLVKLGAKGATSIKEVGENSDIVFSMLLNAQQTESVVFGDDGLFNHMQPGGVVIICSTIAPKDIQRFYEESLKKGIEIIDAPVSGGRIRAENGTLCLMCACTDEAWNKSYDAIMTVGSEAIHCDINPGNGQVYKAANQMFVYANYAVTAEVILMAEKVGLDTRKLAGVIKASRGNSVIFENNVEKYITHNYTMNGRMDISKKDYGIIEDIAEQYGVPMPVSMAVGKVFYEAVARGLGGEDNSAIAMLYEQMADEKSKK